MRVQPSAHAAFAHSRSSMSVIPTAAAVCDSMAGASARLLPLGLFCAASILRSLPRSLHRVLSECCAKAAPAAKHAAASCSDTPQKPCSNTQEHFGIFSSALLVLKPVSERPRHGSGHRSALGACGFQHEWDIQLIEYVEAASALTMPHIACAACSWMCKACKGECQCCSAQ
jgi:hypothetical protein